MTTRSALVCAIVFGTATVLAGRADSQAGSSETPQGAELNARSAQGEMPPAPASSDSAQEYFIFAAPEEQGTVDKFTGTFSLQLADLSVAAGTTALELTRTYGRNTEARGLLGGCWRLNWESSLVRHAKGARIADVWGVTEFFAVDDDLTVLLSVAGEQLALRNDKAIRMRTDGAEDVFSPEGRLVERRVRGSTFSVRYDAHGRLDRIDGPDGASLAFQYEDPGTVRVQASTGDSVIYSVREGLLTRVVRAPGVATDYSYQAGRLSAIRHPQFGSVELTYDAQGLLSTRRWLDGSVERVVREATGMLRHVAADGSLTVTELDPTKRVAAITEPSGQRTVLQFDRRGRIRQVDGPDGKTIEFTHDEKGRLLGAAGSGTGPLVFQYRGDEREPSGAVGPGGTGYTVKHDSLGRVAQVESGSATGVAFQYDSQGRPTRIEPSHAPSMSLGYDKRGRVQSVADALGQAVRFERDARGRINGLVDFGGARTAWTFDDQARVTSETDATGATSRYEYWPSGLLCAVIDPKGAATRFEYRGRSVATTDPLGNKSTTWYDRTGRMERYVDPKGTEHQYEYDAAGNLIREPAPSGGQTRYEYDARGDLVAVTTPDGNRTSFRYDESGNLRETADLLGRKVVCQYDAQGMLQTTILADGTRTLWEVGPWGLREREIVPPEGPATRLGYDSHGNLISVVHGERRVISRRYDAVDRLVEESNDRGLTVRFTYDAMGNLVGWNNSLGGSGTTTYDPLGRPVANSDCSGAEVRFAYDAAGNLVETRDALGNTTRFSADAKGQLTAVRRPSGLEAAYDYDAAGHLIAARIGQQTLLRIDRDLAGNPERLTDALGRATTHRHDAAGRVISRTDPAGRTVSYVYSSSGMLMEKRLPDGPVVSYVYDACGNMTSVDDGEFPVRYSYDNQNRMIRIEYPAIRRTLVRRYDPVSGRLAEFIDSEGRRFAYRYDDAGRLARLDTASQGAFLFRYDAADRLVEIAYPNGVTGRWTYDAAGRLVLVAYQNGNGQILDGVWCDYDKAGRPVRKRMPGDEVHYGYDADDRLVEERREGRAVAQYEYDATGARKAVIREGTKELFTTDAAAQLVSAGAARFEHDAHGNLTARMEAGLVTHYRYDSENRLIEVRLPDGNAVRFGYAPTGERVWREDENGRTYYVTDGLHVWAELDSDLNPTSLYAHGPMLDRPLMMTRGQLAYFYHADELGSVTAVSDSDGKLAQSYRYDAFGNPREGRTASVDSPFRFTGREWDPAARLYFFRTRYYDPQLGRFLSVDAAPVSIGAPETLDAYAYVHNSPTRLVDPMGAQGMPPFPSTDSGAFQALVQGEADWSRANPRPSFTGRQRLFQQMTRYSSHVTVEEPLAVAVNYPRNAVPIRPNTISAVNNAIRGAGGPLNPELPPQIWWRDRVNVNGPGAPSSIPRSVIDARSPTAFRPRPNVGPRTPTVQSPLTGTMPRPPGGAPTRLLPRPPTAGGGGAGSGGSAAPVAAGDVITRGIGRAGFAAGLALSFIDIGDKVVNDRPAGEIAGTVGFHAATHLLMGAVTSQISANLSAMVVAGTAPASGARGARRRRTVPVVRRDARGRYAAGRAHGRL